MPPQRRFAWQSRSAQVTSLFAMQIGLRMNSPWQAKKSLEAALTLPLIAIRFRPECV